MKHKIETFVSELNALLAKHNVTFGYDNIAEEITVISLTPAKNPLGGTYCPSYGLKDGPNGSFCLKAD